MIDAVGSSLRLVLVSIGALVAYDPSTLGTVAVVLAAVALLAVALSTASLPAATVVLRAAARAPVDAGVIPAQSDPDAPGRPRPRAPGLAAPAA